MALKSTKPINFLPAAKIKMNDFKIGDLVQWTFSDNKITVLQGVVCSFYKTPEKVYMKVYWLKLNQILTERINNERITKLS